MPLPQTTAMPHPRSVPARRTAIVSLRTRLWPVQPSSTSMRWIRRSSAGRSAPARQKTPMSAIGLRSGSTSKDRHAARMAPSSAWAAPIRSRPACEDTATRRAPSTSPRASVRTTSVFEAPPSTARIRGRLATVLRAIAKIRNRDETGVGRPKALDDSGKRNQGRRRPAVEQHDDTVATLKRLVDDLVLDIRGGLLVLPIRGIDVPVDIAIAARCKDGQHPRVIGALTKRAAKPRPRISTRHAPNAALGLFDVDGHATVGQIRHWRMGMRVIADDMPGSGNRSGNVGIGGGPAALDEEGRLRPMGIEDVEDLLGDAGRALSPTRMLGIKGKRHPEVIHPS